MNDIIRNNFLNLIQLFLVDPSIGIVTERLEDQDVTDNFGHIESPNPQIHFDMSQTCSANNNDSDDSGDDSVRVAIGTEDQKLKYAIAKGIFEAIELSTKTGASLSAIADLQKAGRGKHNIQICLLVKLDI